MKADVGVIIVNWNLADDTITCAHSVLASEGVSPYVVIVDNGSSDDSVQKLQAALPTLHLLCLPENVGLAGGINAALDDIDSNGFEYIFILNNDTYLAPDCVYQLQRALNNDASAAIAGPLILYADEPERIWYFGDREKPLWPVPKSMFARGECFCGQYKEIQKVDYVSGCAMLIRRAALKALGAFNAQLFMHYEDADFCWRARTAGWKILSVPGARMWHKVSLSSRRLGTQINYYRIRNRIWFYATHRYGFNRTYALAYVLSQELVRCIYTVFTRRQNAFLLCFKAIRHGISGKLGKSDG